MILNKYCIMGKKDGRYYPVLIDNSYFEYRPLFLDCTCSYFNTYKEASRILSKLDLSFDNQKIFKIAIISLKLE